MNPKIKLRWLNALRSGEYQQGRYALLRDVNGKEEFCCLGVLCDLHARATGRYWTERLDSAVLSFDGHADLPSRATERWAGVSGASSPLANMNDKGKTFAHIADWIQKNLQ